MQRSSNLFISIFSIFALATLSIASAFLAAVFLDRTLFYAVMGRSWCFGLFIASIALTSVGIITSSVVYWFGNTKDQHELYTALMSVLSLYLMAGMATAGAIQRTVSWLVVTLRTESSAHKTGDAAATTIQVEKHD